MRPYKRMGNVNYFEKNIVLVWKHLFCVKDFSEDKNKKRFIELAKEYQMKEIWV